MKDSFTAQPVIVNKLLTRTKQCWFIYIVGSFIHSGNFYSTSSSPLLLRGAHDYSTDTVLEFHAEAPQATVSEGLAQGPYVTARTGFEPATLRLIGANVPPHMC